MSICSSLSLKDVEKRKELVEGKKKRKKTKTKQLRLFDGYKNSYIALYNFY